MTAGEGVQLWAEERGDPAAPPLLLVMGANASGVLWPEELVDLLAAGHRVIRYDHRDTGRSSAVFDRVPYAIADLARDAVAVLDALGIERAHVVGMSMGGTLIQLLLLDAPHRLRSATVLCTSALGAGLADVAGTGELPGPAPELLAYWQTMGGDRDRAAELDWRVEHWRLLSGGVLPVDAGWFRALEERAMDHAGSVRGPVAHALADQSGLDRGAELAAVTVPTLVVEAPEDPVNPPPHAAHLAAVVGGAGLVTVPGMGHALPPAVHGPLAAAVAAHTAAADAG
ncbi:alpha/beta fold hydrolase [Geodermatophilus nigrescens]|uniref:Pimeloyl-ACP methyl ester carboxylesterase n=1 Tax=Geodermatophilus nigrescens TaxID=1070870 RepID=A0A1M5HTD0_9ACTN|nr:alpha/beta hydrolase [Geodermatophilus nigrescens]SHG19234.1 Pimeloyl-ACP methyl ester carboxylesterase [Geodermatophilus nigrescens]